MDNSVIVNFINANVFNKTVNKFQSKSSSNFKGYLDAAAALNVNVEKEAKSLFSFWHQGEEIGRIHSLRPSLVSQKAASICRSKSKTLNILDEHGVQKKDHFIFNLNLSEKEIEKKWDEINFLKSLVIKPTMSRGGDGVSVEVKNLNAFLKAWKKAKEASLGKGQIIAEPFFNGLDVRIIVVGGKAVCSVVRLPSYVIGDGESTIGELIDIKNSVRSAHPHHKKFPLIKNRHNCDSVILDLGEILLLSRVGNIHQGGEAVDNTDTVSNKAVKLAEQSVQAISGLGCAGVDLLVKENGEARVLEINTSSNFGIHYYPMYGTPRNPALSVIHEMMKKTLFPAASHI